MLLTAEKNLRYEQNLSSPKMALVVCGNSTWRRVRQLIPEMVAAVSKAIIGSLVEVDMPLPRRAAVYASAIPARRPAMFRDELWASQNRASRLLSHGAAMTGAHQMYLLVIAAIFLIGFALYLKGDVKAGFRLLGIEFSLEAKDRQDHKLIPPRRSIPPGRPSRKG